MVLYLLWEMYVRRTLLRSLTEPIHPIDSFPVRSDANNWHAKDILLLRAETENPGNFVLLWRDPTCVLEMAIYWILRGDIRILEFVWVRLETPVWDLP